MKLENPQSIIDVAVVLASPEGFAYQAVYVQSTANSGEKDVNARIPVRIKNVCALLIHSNASLASVMAVSLVNCKTKRIAAITTKS